MRESGGIVMATSAAMAIDPWRRRSSTEVVQWCQTRRV